MACFEVWLIVDRGDSNLLGFNIAIISSSGGTNLNRYIEHLVGRGVLGGGERWIEF